MCCGNFIEGQAMTQEGKMSDSEFAWATPRPDDKAFVKRHCPKARVVRYPGGRHFSYTCYLNNGPHDCGGFFWCPSPEIAWAEGRRAVEYDLRKAADKVPSPPSAETEER